MLPSLDSIRCFVAAAHLLNFRAAARQVALTPAALGKRIQQLEEQTGKPLFLRTTRRVELTEAGLAMLPLAESLLTHAQDCMRAGRGELGPAPLDLVLGTRHELGLSWLVPMLSALREAAPHVDFHLYFGSGLDLERRVLSHEVDCAISSRQSLDPRVSHLSLHKEEYVMVASPGSLQTHPLEQPEDAVHHTLLDAHADLPLFRYWRSVKEGSVQLHFGRVLSMGTIAAIRALVLADEGVAVLPLYLVKDDLEKGDMVHLFPEVQARHDFFRLLYRREDPHRALYETLVQVMREHPLQ